MTITNGPYHYFLPGRMDRPPRLCEVVGAYVYFTDDYDPVRLAHLTGTFIRLVETGLPLTVKQQQVGEGEAKEAVAESIDSQEAK